MVLYVGKINYAKDLNEFDDFFYPYEIPVLKRKISDFRKNRIIFPIPRFVEPPEVSEEKISKLAEESKRSMEEIEI